VCLNEPSRAGWSNSEASTGLPSFSFPRGSRISLPIMRRAYARRRNVVLDLPSCERGSALFPLGKRPTKPLEEPG